jgi:hypothetical protein
MYRLKSDRRAFLARLGGDRLFLLKHASGLSYALCRRARNRLTGFLASAHRGRKIWPAWLEAHRPLVTPSGTRIAITMILPTFSGCLSARSDQAAIVPRAAQAARDPENSLAEHRWGFLLDAVLAGRVDWPAGLDECTRWIEKNSPKTGSSWEPYSACERVANLLVFLAAMPVAVRGQRITRQLTGFVGESLNWIYRHLEYYGEAQTNNHILNNARALVMGGASSGERAALAAGMKIFRQCLPALIMKGGFLRERSSHYQLIVLNWMLDAWCFVAASDGPASENAQFLRGYASRMASAAAMLCNTTPRLLALIGDVSPDSSPAQSAARLGLLYPDFWPAPGHAREALQTEDGWFRISAAEEVVIGNFPAGRFPPEFPTHGHGDHTSFAWIHESMDVLVDTGRYRYTPDAVSSYQKSALGHNLPLVNGFAPLCESLASNGSWWPLPYARADLQAAERPGGFALSHDGFARATPVTGHSRLIVPQHATLLVTDTFDGSEEVEIAMCWHFGDGFDAFDENKLAATGRGGRLDLSVTGVRGSPRVTAILEDMPGSWLSREYGQRQPILGICLQWQVKLPVVISTRFRLAVSTPRPVHPQ